MTYRVPNLVILSAGFTLASVALFVPYAVHAAPTFMSASTAVSETCSKPTGTDPGDLLIAFVSSYDDSGLTITPPAGWNLVRGPDRRTSGELVTLYSFYKIAGVSEPSTVLKRYVLGSLTPAIL